MNGKMRAIVARGGDNYKIEEVEIPKPGEGEILCRVKACALCGSDPGLFHGHYIERGWPPAYPFIFGHEWSGEVVELGSGVTSLKVGDRVAGEAHSGCGKCENCRKGDYTLCLNYGKPESGHRHYGFTTNGAYAEYQVFTEKSCVKIPDDVSFDEATMCDTGGVALHALEVAHVNSSDYVAVFGPGPIGNLAVQEAKAKGAITIMVGRRHRLQIAKESGADYIVDYETCDPVEEIRKITGGRMADAAIEAAGSQTSVHNAIKSVKKNGYVALIALTKEKDIYVPINDIVCDQIKVDGSRANPNQSEEVLDLLNRKKIDTKHLITHVFPMEEIEKAIDIFEHKRDGAMKVIIHP